MLKERVAQAREEVQGMEEVVTSATDKKLRAEHQEEVMRVVEGRLREEGWWAQVRRAILFRLVRC